MTTTKLPAVVPFNDPVTVCAMCGRAGCLIPDSPFRCRGHNKQTVTHALADIRGLDREHPGYWKGDPNRDPDFPIDLVDLHEMVRVQRKRAHADDRDSIVSYLLHNLNIDPEQVAEAMAAEWPEAVSQ